MSSYLVRITIELKALARSGRVACARKLFDEMPHRDSIAWNAMLSGYSQTGLYQEALSLFHHMRFAGTLTDCFSFTAALSACAGAQELSYGRKIHALVVVLGCNYSLPVNNALIDMYGKCLSSVDSSRVFEDMGLKNEVSWCSLLFAYMNAGQFEAGLDVFNAMPERVNIAWNTMIASHARFGEIELCWDWFKKMLEDSCRPDQWTLSTIVSACAESQELLRGCMVHALINKSGWGCAAEVNNSIISFYVRIGCQDDVTKALDMTCSLNQVSWNVMIDAHMKIGDLQTAFLAFDQAPEKNVVSWTSMIIGYARNGHNKEAVNFFVRMMKNDIQPDYLTFGAVLHACSNLATLGLGKLVHGCTFHNGFQAYAYVGNGLVNMYAKCGDIESSHLAFTDVLEKDLISWNTMLFAFGLHGCALKALRLYADMVALGLKPDRVTFIGLLMTCSHSGLLEEGCTLFESMSLEHGLSPEMDHVACVVDMLGRGGYLNQARALATKNMEISSKEAPFGACFMHGLLEMGAEVGSKLKTFEPQNEMSYVLLSNLYCASGQWNEAEMVRKAMADKGVKKMPGCSWIEVGNDMSAFVAGGGLHPCMEGLNDVLHLLENEIRTPCVLVFDGIA